ncbi:MAG: GNAT family N-acetyltransferase [Xanthomonadales bacterium]|nr:GNAT family N-acetyltransferase [Xanthomonadales bacterium]
MIGTARTVDGISRIGARQWQGLDTRGNPFVSWPFLYSLEASGSVATENGWQPHHLCLYEGDQLVAAAPTYLKSHSRGEFVFDWAWADAYHRNQVAYYPKLLTAVPWTPVAGPRLLTARKHPDPGRLRQRLIAYALERCEAQGLSSWHCNFMRPEEAEACAGTELLPRRDWQFHWHNRGYADFDDFLATLKSRKRKKIRQERRRVSDAGVRFEWLSGADLDQDMTRFVHLCYRRTFHAHGNYPALNLECFERFFSAMPEQVLAVIAYKDGSPLAMSLSFIGDDALYGRYWGTLEDLPGLHFETAYYQGIAFCIDHGLERFESGAQGEHKIARGFEPVKTRSYHHIAHPAFRAAIAQYLEREAEWLDDYRIELNQHRPFRVVSGG